MTAAIDAARAALRARGVKLSRPHIAAALDAARAAEQAEHTLLHTFSNMPDPDRLVRAAQAMSRGTGQSIEHCAAALAKALHDPVRGGYAISGFIGDNAAGGSLEDVQEHIVATVEAEYGRHQ